MKLKDPYVYPPTGWVYTDPDTKVTIVGHSLDDLVKNVTYHRVDSNFPALENLEQMIQDQLCDVLGPSYCDEKGLGDYVHAVAQPIAKIIDMAVGTKIQGCGSCAQRRAALNKR